MITEIQYILNIFKKTSPEKIREHKMETKANDLMLELLSQNAFTDLENVQILNSVRRKLSDHLENKKSHFMELSVNSIQKASEIKFALTFLE